MTDTRPAREPGYRGALPPRVDRIAPIWVATVTGILVLIFVLSALGLPSRLFPEPTVAPSPSIPVPSVSGDPSPSPEAS
jgi:hypothetical protein